MADLEEEFLGLEAEGREALERSGYHHERDRVRARRRHALRRAKSTRSRFASRISSAPTMALPRKEVKALFDEAHELPVQPQRRRGTLRRRDAAGLGDRAPRPSRASR